MPKKFLVTFHLTRGQIQQVIYECSQPFVQNKISKDISNNNINYLKIEDTIIFKKHIKSFDILEIN